MRYLIYLFTALLTFILSVAAVLIIRQDYVTEVDPLPTELMRHICGRSGVTGNALGDEGYLYVEDRDELRKVNDEIARSPDILPRFENTEGAPLTIREVRMKTITRRQYHRITGWSEDTSLDLAYLHTVTLVNNTDRPINCFELAFTGKPVTRADGLRAWLEPRVPIEWPAPLSAAVLRPPIDPHSSFVYRRECKQPLLSVEGDGKELSVKVLGVQFEDGGQWGRFLNDESIKLLQ